MRQKHKINFVSQRVTSVQCVTTCHKCFIKELPLTACDNTQLIGYFSHKSVSQRVTSVFQKFNFEVFEVVLCCVVSHNNNNNNNNNNNLQNKLCHKCA